MRRSRPLRSIHTPRVFRLALSILSPHTLHKTMGNGRTPGESDRHPPGFLSGFGRPSPPGTCRPRRPPTSGDRHDFHHPRQGGSMKGRSTSGEHAHTLPPSASPRRMDGGRLPPNPHGGGGSSGPSGATRTPHRVSITTTGTRMGTPSSGTRMGTPSPGLRGQRHTIRPPITFQLPNEDPPAQRGSTAHVRSNTPFWRRTRRCQCAPVMVAPRLARHRGRRGGVGSSAPRRPPAPLSPRLFRPCCCAPPPPPPSSKGSLCSRYAVSSYMSAAGAPPR